MILGSGWAAARLLRDINSSLCDYTVQFPTFNSNHATSPFWTCSHLFCKCEYTVARAHCCCVQIISPRNHMVFTPLLASTCVGTLECRAVALSLTDIQPHLKETWVRGCAQIMCMWCTQS